MPFTCPHCDNASVGAFVKFRARPSSPVACSNCGQLSAEPGAITALMSVLWVFAMALPFVSLYALSWWPIIGGLGLLVTLELATWAFVPLRALSDTTVRRARLFAIVGAIAVIGMLLYVTYE